MEKKNNFFSYMCFLGQKKVAASVWAKKNDGNPLKPQNGPFWATGQKWPKIHGHGFFLNFKP